MKSILFWISLLILQFHALAYALSEPPIVRPGEYKRYEIKPFEQKLFKIQKSLLDKNTKYEVRVSFLGNVGAEMILKWKNTDDLSFHTMSNPMFRPLDTANLFFRTNENSEILEAHPQSLEIEEGETYYTFFAFMYRNSLARSRELAEKPIEFYITILPVVIPGLGYNVVWAYTLAIVATIIILCVILPKNLKRLPYFKEFLVRDYDPNKRIK